MRRSVRLIQAFIVLLAVPLFACGKTLSEIYEDELVSQHKIDQLAYQLKASGESVDAAKSRFNPKLYLIAEKFWLKQNVYSEGVGFVTEGEDDFLSNRVNLSIEKPLFDSSLSSQISSKAILNQRSELALKIVEEQFTQKLVEEFINASKFYYLHKSFRRVILRLEEEFTKTEQRFEEKLATVTELEEVRLNLASAKLEDALALQNYRASLVYFSLEHFDSPWPKLKKFFQKALPASQTKFGDEPSIVKMLREERRFIDESLRTIKSNKYPKIKAYGRYSRNDADDSVFGGVTDVEDTEVGVSLQWNIYDHNFNQHDISEKRFQSLSKESEISAYLQQHEIAVKNTVAELEMAETRISQTFAILGHQKEIMNAVEDAYRVDAGDFVSMLKAYLNYEAALRSHLDAKYKYMSAWSRLRGLTQGWDKSLVQFVNDAFDG